MKGILRYLLKRLLVASTVILGITFLAFTLSYLCPSDPAELVLESKGNPYTKEMLDAMRKEMGIDQPMVQQYGNWLLRFLKGDLGTSLVSGKPVYDELFHYLPNTIKLTVTALTITMVISIVLGILCAVYVDTIFDYIIRFITYVFASLPSFFFALVLLYIFCVRLKLFPVAVTQDLKGMILPTALLTVGMSSSYIRQVRAIVLEQLSSEYVLGCYARGIPFYQILFKHVLKNAMIPIITLVGISFGGMLGGACIVETIFTWQGVGRYALSAIKALDYTVIQGYVVWMALIYLAMNTLVDVICAFVNPRLRKDSLVEVM